MPPARDGATATHAVAVKRSSIVAPSDITESWVLRALDRASRALAQRLWGEDGVPLGLDAIELYAVAHDVTRPVTVSVSATLLEERVTRHSVEYLVTMKRSAPGDGRPSAVELLAKAAGWTWVPSNGPLNAGFSPAPPAGWRRAT